MKLNLLNLLLFSLFSWNCQCQNNANKIDIKIRDSWSRENSFEISIFPPEESGKNTKMTINSYNSIEKITIISSNDYIELLKLINEITYTRDKSRGSFCTDGTTVSLEYETSKKNYIRINCFRYKNQTYSDVSKVIKYIDSISDEVSFSFE
jgi:hypothetical protein